ncbi:hypothetical protein SAMN06265371_103130 [Lutibacter agarilyticus]|uniref:Secreted protein n=1 Tax=Lutibacter agarilyticus TaxID=1109740 RepID=A0A238WE18_9FLAO|nr:hypothetical protein [Lutibacter agarilyticus]SNR44836.1 hypothetical protein SAMN06265371_103130 [Lutibacter agarilyticus]
MNNSLKIILTIGIIHLMSIHSFAQTFPSNSKILDAEINAASGNKQLNSNYTNTKVAPNANIDLNINKQLNTNAVNNTMNKYATKNDGNFLMETLPEDRDITGKRYLNNKDVTHKRLGTSMDLGTISTTSKVVRVVCRDHSYVDGDIIKIFINEQSLENNVVLKGSSYIVYLNLNKGYNRIDFQALNQGLSGPNTAELLLFDENDNLISAKEWNLLTGEIATLGVIQKD